MGYRNYIGYLPKKEYDKIKNLSKEDIIQLYKFGRYIQHYKLVTELYNFGKGCDIVKSKFRKPFFENKRTQNSIEDEFEVVTKQFLKTIIISYKNKIKKFMTKQYKPFVDNKDFFNNIKSEYTGIFKVNYKIDFSKITQNQQNAIINILNDARTKYLQWNRPKGILNFNNNACIQNTWLYEYAIFDLMYIYKMFNFKNNILVYYGW